MTDSFDDLNQRLADAQDILDPLRELLECHFWDAVALKAEEQPDREGYKRRPTIGLRLEIDPNDKTKALAIRPVWSPPRKYAADLYGTVHTDRIEIELVGPDMHQTFVLQEGKQPRLTCHQKTGYRDHLRTILTVAHDLLMDPEDLFSQQSEHCCCCGKTLTDVVSRTRGIGPECIRLFGAFKAPPLAVEKYRQRYRSLDEVSTF